MIRELDQNGLHVVVRDQICKGDTSDIFLCEVTSNKTSVEPTRWEVLRGVSPTSTLGVLKVARPSYEDLLRNESAKLSQPHKDSDSFFEQFLPQVLVPAFEVAGTTMLVTNFAEGFVSAEEIIAKWPSGIDYRDAAWMFKRILVGLGYIHKMGVIHGSVIPSHVLVHPKQHGGRIIGWTYAVNRPRESIKAGSSKYTACLPPEVLAKQFPTTATDIFMAAKTMVYLLSGGFDLDALDTKIVPEAIVSLLRKNTDLSPSKRHESAWDLHNDFNNLLLESVGPPAYRALNIEALNFNRSSSATIAFDPFFKD